MTSASPIESRIKQTGSRLASYDIGQLIGQGGFAKVYRGVHRQSERKVAIKVVHIGESVSDDHNSSNSTPNPKSHAYSSLHASFEPLSKDIRDLSDGNTSCGSDHFDESPSRRKKSQDLLNRLDREIRIHKRCRHPNIIDLYDCLNDHDTKNVYIVLELAHHGNLYQYMTRNVCPSDKMLSDITLSYLFNDVIAAVKYLHTNRIIHRDIKLSNILICDKVKSEHIEEGEGLSSWDRELLSFTYKLCDFGLSTQLDHPDEEHFTLCGSLNYIAPEIVEKRSHSFPADIWSLGCLLGNILTKIQMIEVNSISNFYSSETISFMKCLLHKDPKNRSNIIEISKHRFLNLYSTYLSKNARAKDSEISFTTTTTTQSLHTPPSSTISGKMGSNLRHSKVSRNLKNEFHDNVLNPDQSSTMPDEIPLDRPLLTQNDTKEQQINQSEIDTVNEWRKTYSSNMISSDNKLISQQPLKMPKYSEEPNLRTSSGNQNGNIHVDVSKSCSSYASSIEQLRQSVRNSLSDTLPLYKPSMNISEPISSSRASFRESTGASSSDTVNTSWLSLIDGLSPFTFVSKLGEVLVLNIHGDILFCCDIEIVPSSSFHPTNKSIVGNKEILSLRLNLNKNRPFIANVSILRDRNLMEYEMFRRGLNLNQIKEFQADNRDAILGIPINPSLSLLNESDDINKWNLLQPESIDSNRLTNTKSLYHKIFDRLVAILEPLRSRMPKFILYLSIQATSTAAGNITESIIRRDVIYQVSKDGPVECKCMLMSNTPLPNFCVQFKDKTIFRYDLHSGDISVDYYIQRAENNVGSKRVRWTGNLTFQGPSSWSDLDGLPPHMKAYMMIAQFAFDRCIVSEKSLRKSALLSSVPVDYLTMII